MSDGNREAPDLEIEQPKFKISKKSNVDDDVDHPKYQPLMKDFTLEKILYNSSFKKSVCVQAKYKDGVALVIFEKNPFKVEDFGENGYFSSENSLRTVLENDVYGTYECFPRSSLNGVKTDIIYPATEQHIAKYSDQAPHLILETPELYETLTLPHIEKEQLNLQWVYNILEGKSEQDRIIYKNKSDEVGFILLPDQKWDGENKETLYLLALVEQRGIKSLRDLNTEHLPLLKAIRDEGKAKILEKYNIPSSQLRIYLHYHPSFYHLHVHFNYLQHEVSGISVERAHLLETVINNIEIMGDYYKKASLYFIIREMNPLFKLYESNGHVKKTMSEIADVDK